MIAGIGSNWAPVLSGVPQGSVLGPVVCISYMNDMPNINMYADDTKICREMSDNLDCIKLQVDLNNVQKWSEQ